MLLDLSLNQTWFMDRAYNSRAQVTDSILEVQGQVVMPSKINSIDQRDYDRHLYKARHLIENFFATRYDKLATTSYQRSTWLQQSSGLIDDKP